MVSYGFNEADEKNGVYDYTVYVNDSGTPDVRLESFNLGIGDLGPRISMMNAAIFDSYGFSKKLSQPYSEGFKPEFICNREELLDAWLNDSPMPPLNCPSLLFGFFALPIVDFIITLMMIHGQTPI